MDMGTCYCIFRRALFSPPLYMLDIGQYITKQQHSCHIRRKFQEITCLICISSTKYYVYLITADKNGEFQDITLDVGTSDDQFSKVNSINLCVLMGGSVVSQMAVTQP